MCCWLGHRLCWTVAALTGNESGAGSFQSGSRGVAPKIWMRPGGGFGNSRTYLTLGKLLVEECWREKSKTVSAWAVWDPAKGSAH
jgi:hypothetical protein